MVLRRIGYLILLLGAAAAFFLSEHYLALYALVLVVMLPVVSLALSRPLLGSGRLILSVSPARLERNECAQFTLTLQSAGPVTRVDCTVQVENRMTGATVHRRVTLPQRDGDSCFVLPVPAGHCGVVVCTVRRGRMWDFLGLFPWKIPLPPSAAAVVSPVFLEGGALPEELRPRKKQPVLRPRPGGGPGEDYELRDYRPGDPLRTVHWKCSARRDALVVREVLEETPAAVVLTFDHVGPPETLDQVLDRVQALSRRLLEEEEGHFLVWRNSAGQLQWAAVTVPNELAAGMERILSTPAGNEGQSVAHLPVELPGWTGTVRRFHVTASLWPEGGPS